jgi:hypothetical protein
MHGRRLASRFRGRRPCRFHSDVQADQGRPISVAGRHTYPYRPGGAPATGGLENMADPLGAVFFVGRRHGRRMRSALFILWASRQPGRLSAPHQPSVELGIRLFPTTETLCALNPKSALPRS